MASSLYVVLAVLTDEARHFGDGFIVGIVVVIIQGIFTLMFMLLRFMFQLFFLAIRAASRGRR